MKAQRYKVIARRWVYTNDAGHIGSMEIATIYHVNTYIGALWLYSSFLLQDDADVDFYIWSEDEQRYMYTILEKAKVLRK